MGEGRWTAQTVIGGFLWAVGTIASSLMTVMVIEELAAHGARANMGWGALGLYFIQPPATLAVLIGASLLWRRRPSHEIAIVEEPLPELGGYRTPASEPAPRMVRWSPRWILAAGLLWSCIAYAGLLFHNSGC